MNSTSLLEFRVPITARPLTSISPTNSTPPAYTDMRGVYRHNGDTQFYMCFYHVCMTFATKDYQSSWLLRGYGGEGMEINLEIWEVGQLLGGN